MLDFGPSTSGRGTSVPLSSVTRLGGHKKSSEQGLSRLKPERGCRGSRVTCQALAVPRRLPLLRALQQLIRPYQVSHAEAFLVGERREDREALAIPARPSLGAAVKQATAAALHVGIVVTGIALRLARRAAEDLWRTVRFQRAQRQAQRAAAAERLLSASANTADIEDRERLRNHGKDVAFMRMLHVLDRCHIDHDAKWSLIQQHTADKAEFCTRLKQLFEAACNSKDAVETLLRPGASRSEINRFWKSQQTARLIAEEERLKQLVFAQMLQGA